MIERTRAGQVTRESPGVAPAERREVSLGYAARSASLRDVVDVKGEGEVGVEDDSFSVSTPRVGHPQEGRQDRCEIDGCQK